MKRFVGGEDRRQGVLLPEFLDDYVAEDNPVRAIDVFVDKLDLRGLGFSGVCAGGDRSARLSSGINCDPPWREGIYSLYAEI